MTYSTHCSSIVVAKKVKRPTVSTSAEWKVETHCTLLFTPVKMTAEVVRGRKGKLFLAQEKKPFFVPGKRGFLFAVVLDRENNGLIVL